MSLLTENDEKILQPEHISIKLLDHQRTIIYKMQQLEESGIIKTDKNADDIDYTKKNNCININTNIGILGDKVGAGKTLTTVSLISMNKKLKDRNAIISGEQYFTLSYETKNKKLDCNLIVVPQKILHQWNNTFKCCKNLNVLVLEKNKDIDKIVKKIIKKDYNNKIIEKEEIIEEDIINYDVILIGENIIYRFYFLSTQYKWNRIFIDEADTIKNISCIPLYEFNFAWIITGTPEGLKYRKIGSISKIFKDYKYRKIYQYFIIKNDDNYIDQSIKLPYPNRFEIKCTTPKELLIIKDLIPSNILQMINAGNSEEAIKVLNFNVDTNDNILQIITKNIKDSITNKQIELEAEHKKVYPVQFKKEHDQRIKTIENSLSKLEKKYEDIKKKIYELNDEYCPICMSNFVNPVIVDCCNNCFCFDCLAVSLGTMHNNKCVYCRQLISKSNIHVISDNNNIISKNKYDLKEKMDVLIDIINNRPDGSIMIFANYADTFNKIEIKLKELSINYHILKGQSTIVEKNIEDFKNKKVKVLMLNAQYFGAGMNLEMTTDLIIYHRFNTEMEEQIIGRAQRYGRTTSLNVYYLLHENESNMVNNKFKFEDKTSIHYLDWLNQNNNKNENDKNENKTESDKNNKIESDKNDKTESDKNNNYKNIEEVLDISDFTIIN